VYSKNNKTGIEKNLKKRKHFQKATRFLSISILLKKNLFIKKKAYKRLRNILYFFKIRKQRRHRLKFKKHITCFQNHSLKKNQHSNEKKINIYFEHNLKKLKI